jgi:hypothetical protein
MATFDTLLTAYVGYNNLADAAAQTAFLREGAGVKTHPWRDVYRRPR